MPSNAEALAAIPRAARCEPWILAQSGVAVPLTGTTSETTLASIVLPARALGKNGALRIVTLWSMTSSANNKTPRIKLGGTTFVAPVYGTGVTSLQHFAMLRNRGAANSQVAHASTTQNVFGAGAGSAVTTGAVDTAADQPLVITGQLALGTETLTLEAFTVEVLPQ